MPLKMYATQQILQVQTRPPALILLTEQHARRREMRIQLQIFMAGRLMGVEMKTRAQKLKKRAPRTKPPRNARA
jgi:hypothetical protein